MSNSIKAKGLIRENQDVVHTEFFKLSDWMQQSTMFNVLTSMKFFRTYINGKIFQLWKGNVRHKKYLRTRQKLARNLIWSRQAFLPTYLKINKGLLKMSLNKTFTLPISNKPYSLDDFNKEQKQERENTKKAYIVDDFIDDLTKIAQEITKSKEIQDEEDFENSKSQVKKVKHKSMVVQKEEENIKNQISMIAKRNISSIGIFIKLVDYMVVETQVSIAIESI